MSKKGDLNPEMRASQEEDANINSPDNTDNVDATGKKDNFEKTDSEENQSKLIEKKDIEIKELTNQIQRLAAEFDNFRKRTIKEKERIYVDAISDVVEKFLPAADNLERAINAAEQEEGKGLKEGVNLVLRQIIDILAKLEVKPIEAVGSCFDPEIHNAVMHIEDESVDCNMVVEEFQKGYIYKDETVIRHSVVKVAN